MKPPLDVFAFLSFLCRPGEVFPFYRIQATLFLNHGNVCEGVKIKVFKAVESGMEGMMGGFSFFLSDISH